MREGPLKQAGFTALRLSGLLTLAETLSRGVPILAYHGVTARSADDPANRRRLHVSRAEFERHLRLLTDRYRPISLRDLVGFLERGATLPGRAVVVTFDDGYRNFATQAWPLLVRYRVPATLFVPTEEGGRLWEDRLESALLGATAPHFEWGGRVFDLSVARGRDAALSAVEAQVASESQRREDVLGQLLEQLGAPPETADEDRDRLSWDELRRMQGEGLEVGSHADRHLPLPLRPAAEAADGLRRSLATLVSELGPSCPPLSYPYGARGAQHVSAASRAGFLCAVTGVPKLATRGAGLFELPRLLVGAKDDGTRLRASLAGLRRLWQGDPWPAR